jgi:hypothetical protein
MKGCGTMTHIFLAVAGVIATIVVAAFGRVSLRQ